MRLMQTQMTFFHVELLQFNISLISSQQNMMSPMTGGTSSHTNVPSIGPMTPGPMTPMTPSSQDPGIVPQLQ